MQRTTLGLAALLLLAACAGSPIPGPGEATAGPEPINPGDAPGNVPGPVVAPEIDSSTEQPGDRIDPAPVVPGVAF